MMVTARRARFASLLAVALGLASPMAESASANNGSASAALTVSVGVAPVSHFEPTTMVPDLTVHRLLAQAGDLAAPPSPEAIATTPPPAPFAEMAPPPLPGYVWDPGHWAWDGGQYVWEPGKYIVQPTNGATYTPGHWRQYSAGWAWVDGRWSWGTQGEGE